MTCFFGSVFFHAHVHEDEVFGMRTSLELKSIFQPDM